MSARSVAVSSHHGRGAELGIVLSDVTGNTIGDNRVRVVYASLQEITQAVRVSVAVRRLPRLMVTRNACSVLMSASSAIAGV